MKDFKKGAFQVGTPIAGLALGILIQEKIFKNKFGSGLIPYALGVAGIFIGLKLSEKYK